MAWAFLLRMEKKNQTHNKQKTPSQVWWHIPVILALGGDQEFKVVFSYIEFKANLQ